MTKLIIGKDIHSTPTYSIEFSDESFTADLKALSNRTQVVPAGMRKMLISPQVGITVYVEVNGEPVIPVNDAGFSPSLANINPSLRDVLPGETINFKSIEDGHIQVGFFEI